MSNRTEKERRRQERLEAERRAEQAAGRKRTLRIGAGALVTLLAIGAIALVALAGDDSGSNISADQLKKDAAAAGCEFEALASEGRGHKTGVINSYKTNPPSSGEHNPTPAPDGVYAPGNTPNKENLVHTLEHGRIVYEYKPGTPADQVQQFRDLAEEPYDGTPLYHVVFAQNNTKMQPQFALVAWSKLLTCDKLTDDSKQVMRDFRVKYTDQGPEFAA